MLRFFRAALPSLLLAAAMALALLSCGGGEESGGFSSGGNSPAPTVSQVAAALLASQEGEESLPSQLFSIRGDGSGSEREESAFKDCVADLFSLDEGGSFTPDEDIARVTEGVVVRPGESSAFEIAVLRLRAESDGERACELLTAWAVGRADTFAGYAPADEAMARRALVTQQGDIALLCICPNPAAAERALRDAFGGKTDTLPALTLPTYPFRSEGGSSSEAASEDLSSDLSSDPYDEDAILTAYRTGDESALSVRGVRLLARCREVLASLSLEGKDDAARELALHDWMTANGAYDDAVLYPDAGLAPTRDNDTPYGFLLEGKGICRGYATTFQLFMDLLGIPCLTVDGSGHGGEAHAWNLVQLDGEWYAVDVTWDDPVGGPAYHRYFNVTSDFLRETSHVWDESAYPEATGTAHAWVDLASGQ